MSTKRFKQILPTSKFALSTEEDTYTSVSVDGDMREIPEVETDENVLSDEVFANEREKGTKYRISAQLDMTVLVNDPYIGFNGLPKTGVPYQSLSNPTETCTFYDGMSSANYGENDIYPLLNNKNDKNNWFTKVLYPESYMPNDTQIGFSKQIYSGCTINRQDGLPIIGVRFVELDDQMYPCLITETDVQLQPDDYVYIDLKYLYNSAGAVSQSMTFPFLVEYLIGFRRVVTTTLNPLDLGITLDGYLPADSKLFVIDSPLTNVNKVSPTFINSLPLYRRNPLQNLNDFRVSGSYKRVIGVSKNDISPNGYGVSNSYVAVDRDNTLNATNGQYTRITVTNPHGLSAGFYIASRIKTIQNNVTPGSQDHLNHYLTGIFRVDSVVDEYTFIIDANRTNPLISKTDIEFKVVDAIASDYMIRVFKELSTTDDYVIDRTAFAENIYKDGTFLLNFIKDIETEGLTDYLGRPLSELFVGVIKRAGRSGYDWTNVVSHFSHIMRGIEGNVDTGLGNPGSSPIPGVMPVISDGYNASVNKSSETTSPLEFKYNFPTKAVVYPSGRSSLLSEYGSDTLSEYYGDIVEYNRGELSERVISDVYHRFNTQYREVGYLDSCDGYGGAYEGLYYKPFHRYQIKKWADAVEAATPPAAQPDDPFSAYTEAIQFEGVPTYAEEVQGLKIWRDLLGPGNFDSVGGLDYPFLNGGHYLYNNIKIYLRRQTPGRSGFDLRVIQPNFIPGITTYTPDESC